MAKDSCSICGATVARVAKSAPQIVCQPCRRARSGRSLAPAGRGDAVGARDLRSGNRPKAKAPYGRKRGTCAACGKVIWRGSTSLPEGEATCRTCRNPSPRPRPVPAQFDPLCKCAVCGDVFERARARQVYCTPACRDRARRVSLRTPTPEQREASRLRDRARYAKRRGMYAAGWRELRAQVLSEESDCHLCGYEIDSDLVWPDPWSGTVDHVIPLAAGGAPRDRANLRAAHFWCNTSKGAGSGRAAAS